MSAPKNDNDRGPAVVVSEAKSNQQLPLCLGLERTGKPKKIRKKSLGKRWQRYEMLKAQYTATALTPGLYAQACRRAAEEAGV